MARFFFLILFCCSVTTCLARTPVTTQSETGGRQLVVEETFDSDRLSKDWHINTGSWTVSDRVLKAKEIPTDKHSAAARRKVMTEDATYELRFRFVGKAKGFHFGFDPAPGELQKKGHLFSVIVTPAAWKLMKHVDKNRPKEFPNQNLAQDRTEFEVGKWYSLRVVTSGTNVTASIEGKTKFDVSDDSFAVKKPTLVFRCIGDGVEVDDVKVWKHTE